MTANPIDVAIVDGSPVGKSTVRGYEKLRVRQRVADATELRNTDFTLQFGGLYVASIKTLFDIDTTDTTTADDGASCIVDFVGNRFKAIAVGGSSSAAAAENLFLQANAGGL